MKSTHKVRHMLVSMVLIGCFYRAYVYVLYTYRMRSVPVLSHTTVPDVLPQSQSQAQPNQFACIDQAITAVLQRPTFNKPGVSVVCAIRQHDKPSYVQTYGDTQSGTLAPTTRMRIGGLTRCVTRVALETLIKDGLLNALDISVWHVLARDGNTLIPLFDGLETPKDVRVQKITIQHILDGAMGFNKDDDLSYHMNEVAQALDIYSATPNAHNVPTSNQVLGWAFSRHILHNDPGTPGVVSPLGYMLLGRVIEKISGMSYCDYVRTRVCNNQSYTFDCGSTPGTATSVDQEIPQYVTDQPDYAHGYFLQSRDAADGLVTSAPELAQFFEQHLVSNKKRTHHVIAGKKRYMWGILPTTMACVYIRPEHNIVLTLLINTCASDVRTCRDDQQAIMRGLDAALKSREL